MLVLDDKVLRWAAEVEELDWRVGWKGAHVSRKRRVPAFEGSGYLFIGREREEMRAGLGFLIIE